MFCLNYLNIINLDQFSLVPKYKTETIITKLVSQLLLFAKFTIHMTQQYIGTFAQTRSPFILRKTNQI